MSRQPPKSSLIAPAFQERKPVRGSLVWWLRFMGIAAFIVLLVTQLPRSKTVHLSEINLGWLGFCMLLTLTQLLLESFVWQWLMAMQRIPHPYRKTLVAYLASQYLGLVTPGHVGEFLAAGYISMNTGITFGYALSSVVMKKALFWVATIGFGIWGLPLLAEISFLQGVRELIWTGVVVLAVLSAGIALWVVSLRRLGRKWQRLSPWQIDMTEFWAGMRHLCSVQLVVPLAIAAVVFGLLFVQLDAILRAMGLTLPLLLVAKMMALSRIAARLVPVSVVGFGSKDAALIILLSQQGIEMPVAFAATLLFLICSYLVTLLLSGACWWIKPLVIRRPVSR
jgi:uncharacterized membrane protein YbhN (UPF0104 family)